MGQGWLDDFPKGIFLPLLRQEYPRGNPVFPGGLGTGALQPVQPSARRVLRRDLRRAETLEGGVSLSAGIKTPPFFYL